MKYPLLFTITNLAQRYYAVFHVHTIVYKIRSFRIATSPKNPIIIQLLDSVFIELEAIKQVIVLLPFH